MTDGAGEPFSSRLMNALQAAHNGGRLRFIGGDRYTVEVERSRGGRHATVFRSGTTDQMWAWLNGMKFGAQLPERMDGPLRVDGWWSTGGLDAAGERLARARRDVAAFRQLILDPSLADMIRIQVLAGMEQHSLNFKDLAQRIGKGDQSVRDALLFGNPNPRIGNLALFDLMLRELKVPVKMERFPLAPSTDVVDVLSEVPFEPAGVTRMRALVIAVETHLIDGVSPGGLQRARRARDFKVMVAGHEVVRPRETLIHWLRGLADGAGDPRAMLALNLA